MAATTKLIIPLDLGGADEDTNLWPEPRRSIEPMWNAERKDRLEWRLADMGCGGQLHLATVQRAIRDNWIDAYRPYIGERWALETGPGGDIVATREP